MGKNQWVVRHGDSWAQRGEGSDRVTRTFDRQEDAIGAARETARRERSELIIQGEDGEIRARTSDANDPHPRRGEVEGGKPMDCPPRCDLSRRPDSLVTTMRVDLATTNTTEGWPKQSRPRVGLLCVRVFIVTAVRGRSVEACESEVPRTVPAKLARHDACIRQSMAAGDQLPSTPPAELRRQERSSRRLSWPQPSASRMTKS